MKEKTLKFETECIRIEFAQESGNISSIYNKISALELLDINILHRNHPFELKTPFSLLIFDSNGRKKNKRHFTKFNYLRLENNKGLILLWNINDDFIVKVKVNSNSDGEILLYPEVFNKSINSVISLTFPIIYPINKLNKTSDNTYLAHPIAGGMLFKNPSELFVPRKGNDTEGIFNCRYPDGDGAGMQFIQYYLDMQGGFYFAFHDPFDTYKELDFYRSSKDLGLTMSFTHKSWNIYPGSGLPLEYPMIIKSLEEGNWYEGAEIYRNWATRYGSGSPKWCFRGRLEDRVQSGDAARWLVEDIGLCVFGIPSSINVSSWLEYIHRIVGRPILYVFGNDWPAWNRASIDRTRLINDLCTKLNLPPIQDMPYFTFWPHYWNAFLRPCVTDPLKKLAKDMGIRNSKKNLILLGDLVKELTSNSQWPAYSCEPLEWFPSRYDSENIEAIRRNGDYFVPFFLDFFGVEEEFKSFGIVSEKNFLMDDMNDVWLGALQYRWMDPTTDYWQNAYAKRDSRIIKEDCADGVYHDISACCGITWSDREDHNHPIGFGRWLLDAYRDILVKSRNSMNLVSKNKYYPLGIEEAVENLIPGIDFSQWRAGGQVQADIETIRFMDWIKEDKAKHISLFSYVYHEYGPVFIDGWSKLSPEFGDIFYYILSEVFADGGIPELNYEYSPLEVIPDTDGHGFQFVYFDAIYEEKNPYFIDNNKVQFLHKLAIARTSFAKKYLCYGKSIRPANILSQFPQIEYSWYHYNSLVGRKGGGKFRGEAIVHRGWSYRNMSRGYIFINTSGKAINELEIELTCTQDYENLLSDGIFYISEKEEKRLCDIPKKWPKTISISLPSHEVILIEIR